MASLDLSYNLERIIKLVQRKVLLQSNFKNYEVTFSPPRLLVFSYGAPRVGNRAFAKWVRKTVPNMFRVEVDGDLICRMPHVTYTCGKSSLTILFF